MIKYKLKCEECSYTFDSWFSSSKKYDKVKKLNLIHCSNCNSKKIIKTIMSPNINNSRSKKLLSKKANSGLLKKIFEYQSFIRKNFEYVGDKFAYEARSIHYDKKRKNKAIYGKASPKDIKELKSEGIETHTFPWLSEKIKDN